MILAISTLCVVVSLFRPSVCDCDCPNPGPNDPLPSGSEWQNCSKPHEFYSCGSACQTECETLGETCRIQNIRCNDACYCCKGYARDCDGNCIPIRRCPPKGTCEVLL